MSVSKAPENNQEFFNLYLNAVHQQDQWVGSIVRHVRQSAFGPRTVIVLTSDHGEAFREHNQMGHTFSIFDEEVHVPGWIDVPPGTVTPEQASALNAKRDEYVFHSDLAATVIDLLGVWDDPGIRRYRDRMHGVSLLDARTSRRAVPMTNCAGVWSCAFENWGYMRGPLKLEARSWDPAWHCFDVSVDPYEDDDLGTDRCDGLEAKALGTFGRLPGSDG
jgi:arylsulfatase A-like enzyme